jgi:hypothetical protein
MDYGVQKIRAMRISKTHFCNIDKRYWAMGAMNRAPTNYAVVATIDFWDLSELWVGWSEAISIA